MYSSKIRVTWAFTILSLTIVWRLGIDDVHRNRYLPKSIDLLTATASELSHQLSNGSITSIQLVKEYHERIQMDNAQGLSLRAVLSMAPRHITLATAEARDKERRNGISRGPLHGIPIFIKGNMATGPDLNMSTSFGAYAFENATTDHDAFLVAKAREAGMIIMGKTNLGEFNGFKDQTISPAWSALGGETISPYDNKVRT
ncbi:hypothetical protein IMSHALPRED_010096 [Imshaugia aleurites]|uniref:Amidase domain-containing protein n=1 Tax=Imshaugia aleurites TaxID=172621 RepID=A0A8H3G5Q7_9LECA|nr:hypothetical protein IMSHALPRED_010096 [Imshaugia aleurites]